MFIVILTNTCSCAPRKLVMAKDITDLCMMDTWPGLWALPGIQHVLSPQVVWPMVLITGPLALATAEKIETVFIERNGLTEEEIQQQHFSTRI